MADPPTHFTEATYNHLVNASSDPSPAKPLSQVIHSVTQVPDSQDQEKLSSVKTQPPGDSESIVQDSVELDRRPQQAPQNSTVLDILEPSQPPKKDPAVQHSIGSPIVLSKSQLEDDHDQDLDIIVQPVHNTFTTPNRPISYNIEQSEEDLYSVSPDVRQTHTSQSRTSLVPGTEITFPDMPSKASTRKSATAPRQSGKPPDSVSKNKVPQRSAHAVQGEITNTGSTSSTALLKNLRAGGQIQANVTQQLVPRPEASVTNPTVKKIAQKAPARSSEARSSKKPVPQSQSEQKALSKSQPPAVAPADNLDEYNIPESPKENSSKPVAKNKSAAPPPTKKSRGRPRKSIPAADRDDGDAEFRLSNTTKARVAPGKTRTRASTRAQTANVIKDDRSASSVKDDTEHSSIRKKMLAQRTSTKPRAPATMEVPTDDVNSIPDVTSAPTLETPTNLRQRPGTSSKAGSKQALVPTAKEAQLMQLVTAPDQQDQSADLASGSGVANVVGEVDDGSNLKLPTASDGHANTPYESHLQQGLTRRSPITIDDGDEDDQYDELPFDATITTTQGQEVQENLPFQPAPPSRVPNKTTPSLRELQHPAAVDPLPLGSLSEERIIRKPNIVGFNDIGPKNQGSLHNRGPKDAMQDSHYVEDPPEPVKEDAAQLPSTTLKDHQSDIDDREQETVDTHAAVAMASPEVATHLLNPDFSSSPMLSNPENQLDPAAKLVQRPSVHVASLQKSKTQKGNAFDADHNTNVPKHRNSVGPSIAPISPEHNEHQSATSNFIGNPVLTAGTNIGQAPVISTRSMMPPINHKGKAPAAIEIVTTSTTGMFKRPHAGPVADPVKRPRFSEPEVSNHQIAKSPVFRQAESQKLSNIDGEGSKLREKHKNSLAAPNNPNPIPAAEVPIGVSRSRTQAGRQNHPHAVVEWQPRIEPQAPSRTGIQGHSQASKRSEKAHPRRTPFDYSQLLSPRKLAMIQKSVGLLDALRSEVEQQNTEQPNDVPSRSEADEGIEDDPDKTLVNDVSDEDGSSESTGSSDTSRESSQQNALLWRNALKPHQGDVHDALIRIAHKFVAHLIDHETAIEDTTNDYSQDGVKLIKRFEQGHEERFEIHRLLVEEMQQRLAEGFNSLNTSLQQDVREIKASGEQYRKIVQKSGDAGQRLEQIMQAYQP